MHRISASYVYVCAHSNSRLASSANVGSRCKACYLINSIVHFDIVVFDETTPDAIFILEIGTELLVTHGR